MTLYSWLLTSLFCVQVIWNRLYNTSSGMDAGTLFQIRNLINRRNVVKDPTNNVAASEDFILLVIEAHILSTAMTVLKMNSLDDTPSHDMFKIPADANSLQRREVLLKAANLVIDSFVDISFACGDEENKPPKKRRGKKRDNQPTNDGVKAYACEILNLGLLLMEFNDGIRENDGNRIVRCWQYMMLVFKANGRTNYSMEALNLLIQLHYTLSPRMAAQLKWNRTVNVHGRPGKNVSSDLHMEHLNRLCKNAISGMGANVTGQSIQRVGRAIKVLSETMQELDKHLGISQESDFHTTRSSDKDLKEVLKQIFEETCVFSHIPGRTHRNFPDFVPNSMRSLSRKKLEQWITTNANKILIYH